MKIEPDPPPRHARWHQRILAWQKLGGYRNAYNVELACGHTVTAFGDPTLLEGCAFCAQCREREEKEKGR